LALVALAVIVGCASGPDTPPAEIVDRPEFKIIEHKNSTLGGDIPDWTTMDEGALEADDRFEGKFVFRFEETGADLQGVKAIADNMRAPSELARLISTRVEQVFAGAEVGDQDFVETYFENVVKTVSETEVNGFRKYGDFWVLKEYTNSDGSAGRREYAYYTLYTIDEAIVEELVGRAINGLTPETEEEVSARERVRQIMNEEL
jgi:hypothetical protein